MAPSSVSSVCSLKEKKKRTKTGCWTCRARKTKCDERKPTCRRCETARRECQGYGGERPKPLLPGPIIRSRRQAAVVQVKEEETPPFHEHQLSPSPPCCARDPESPSSIIASLEAEEENDKPNVCELFAPEKREDSPCSPFFYYGSPLFRSEDSTYSSDSYSSRPTSPLSLNEIYLATPPSQTFSTFSASTSTASSSKHPSKPTNNNDFADTSLEDRLMSYLSITSWNSPPSELPSLSMDDLDWIFES